MKKSFDNLAKLKAYTDPNFAGRDWNLATAMVIKGDALVQVMAVIGPRASSRLQTRKPVRISSATASPARTAR